MKKDKNLDELFRDKLLNYEQEPPAYLLENILAGAAGVRRKKKVMIWRVAGVAAALLLAFVAGWQLNTADREGLGLQVVVNEPQATEAPDLAGKKTVAAPSVAGSEQLASGQVSSGDRLRPIQDTPAVKSEKFTAGTERLPAGYIQVASNEESGLLKPLKSILGLISQDKESVLVLQEKKREEVSDEVEEKTIDQQIMEMNHQMMVAQNGKEKKGRWLVGGQVAPAYNVNKTSQSEQYANNMLSSSSDAQVELGGGVSVEYKTNKRWSIQSGVYYSGLGQKSGNTGYSGGRKEYAFSDQGAAYFNASANIDARTSNMMMNSASGVIEFSGIPSGIVLGTSIEDKSLSSAVVVSEAQFIQNFEYIEIPLYLRYTLIDSRFDVEMMGGFSSNLLVGNQTFMDSGEGKTRVGRTKDMEALNYSGTLGLGFRYGLSKHISLNLEPRIKYYLNSLNSNSSVDFKPYSVGIFTGLSYEF